MKHKNRCDIQCSNFLFRTHLSDTIDKDEQQQFSMKKMTFETIPTVLMIGAATEQIW